MPKLDRFQFAAALRPAGKVSGDFYDIFRLDEKHYGFYVADAVGHGVPAALLTVFVKKGLQTRETAAEGYRLLPPGEVLACLNRDIISQQLADSSFITIFYAVLDAESGRLSYACGGHPPALLSSADGVRRPLLCEGALLGIFETEFATGELTLSPGDCLLLYTDGIEEAHSPTGKKGLDALLEFLDARAVLAPASASQEPGDTLTRHLENALAVLFEQRSLRERRDDVTTLVLRMFA
jgi:sigma-B regulation protein RsbU (phosphoserine phosphatase)